MGRHSCCYKQKLRKGLWSPEEDEKLMNHITKHGHGCWSSVPKLAGMYNEFFFPWSSVINSQFSPSPSSAFFSFQWPTEISLVSQIPLGQFNFLKSRRQIVAGLQRCGKSCRLRWINYLRPDLKRGAFSQDEEDLIIELHAVLGNR